MSRPTPDICGQADGPTPNSTACALEPRGASPPSPDVCGEPEDDGAAAEAPLPTDPWALDAEIRAVARFLAGVDLEMGRLAARVRSSGARRTQGYADFGTWAAERVGVSASTLEHRITLHRRAERCPELAEALLSGAIGTSAAMAIGRLFGPHMSGDDARAWVERAARRTVVHLREEVEATLLRTRVDPSASRGPPDAAALEEAAELDRQVASGELFRSLLGCGRGGPQMFVDLLAQSAGHTGAFRLRLPADQVLLWRALEARFRASAGPDVSFLAIGAR